MDEGLPRKPLREWRESRFMTLQDVAEAVGVRLQTVWNWEKAGVKPEFRNMRALAKALGIQPSQIIIPESQNPKSGAVAA